MYFVLKCIKKTNIRIIIMILERFYYMKNKVI